MVKTFDFENQGARVSSSMPAKICITNNVTDFAELWPRSNKLGKAQCYAFQCAEVLELHCETFVPAQCATPWFVAVVNQEGSPLILFPFMVVRRKHVDVLKFIDFGLSDYNAPILFPQVKDWDVETVLMVWREIKKRLPFDIAVFEKLTAKVADLANPLSYLPLTPQEFSSHQITLRGTWTELSQRLPRERLFKIRRLKKRGTVDFLIAESPEEYDALIMALMQQKSRRDIEAHGGDTLIRPGFRSYLKLAKKFLYPNGPIILFALKVDGVVIATHWGYIFGSGLHSLIPTFEAGEWYRYSPGVILADKILEWCFDQRLSVFDYGVGDEKYKERYCDTSTTLYRGEFVSTTRGRVYVKLREVKRFAKKWMVQGA